MKLVIAAAALSLAAAPPAAAPQPAAPAQPAVPATAVGSAADMNIHQDRPGCLSIRRQVQEESKRAETRRGEARRLGEEPSAHLLLAVDRQVGGCREVTFLRRNVAPGSTMPNVRPAPR